MTVSWAFGSAGAISSAPAQALAEHWKERIRDRLDGIRSKAESKAQGRPLQPNERVAFKVLSEGAFNDDALVADYLGGVLAASSPDDDRGAAVVAVIGRLSSDQLRLHYVMYRALSRLMPAGLNLHSEDARQARLRIPHQDLAKGHRETGDAAPRLHNVCAHA